VRGNPRPQSFFVRDGRFVSDLGDGEDAVHIDADEGMLLPAFVEPHLHLDKALLGLLGSDGGLADAIRLTAEYKRTVTREDIRHRATAVIEREVAAGTTHIRAHTDVDPIVGLLGVEVLLELRHELADIVDLEIVAFPQEGVLKMPGTLALLREALEAGAQVLGGCTYNEATVVDSRRQIDELLALAAEFAVPLDLHADLADDAADERYFLAEYIAQRRIQTGFPHPLTLAHVTSWSGVPAEVRDRTIGAVKDAEIGVVVMPATDMHFGGRSDEFAVRRGIAPVARLWDAGVPVACATNNVRNAFTPYGNADPLESALFLAQTCHLAGPEQLGHVLDAVTVTAASVVGRRDYGVEPGCSADFTILDVADGEEAVLSRPQRRWVVKGGRIVAENERKSRLFRATPTDSAGTPAREELA
jgi:cytosine deaminase